MKTNLLNGSLVDFSVYDEGKGSLTPIYISEDILFPVGEISWSDRDGLSNLLSDFTDCLLIPLHGNVELELKDTSTNGYLLDQPNRGVFLAVSLGVNVKNISSGFVGLVLKGLEQGQTKVGSNEPATRKYSIDDCSILSFKNKAVEINQELFPIERVFYIYNIPQEAVRGMHSHRTYHEILIAVNGSLDVEVDDGVTKKIVRLDDATKGLYLPPGIWAKQLNFSSDTCCLVFASGKYGREGYINSYEDFLKFRDNEDNLI